MRVNFSKIAPAPAAELWGVVPLTLYDLRFLKLRNKGISSVARKFAAPHMIFYSEHVGSQYGVLSARGYLNYIGLASNNAIGQGHHIFNFPNASPLTIFKREK